ncbi:MAG: efflux RND transporter periplasmic adaptor subunit [Devosia sp.]|nr:efflux RND transporter periplasmic adaptor subunit [Devosia sp.]
MSRPLLRTALLALAGLATVPLAACGGQVAAPAPAVRPVLSVVVHPVASQTVGPYVGDIEPRYETPLSFQSSGRILSRPVRVGDTVKKGQLLASLDASVQQFQLASAQAALASAQSQYSNLAASEERAKSLVASGAAAQAQLDTATSTRQTAEASLAQAKASLAQAQNELGFTSIIAGFDGVVVSVGAEVGQVVAAGLTVVTIARPDVREAVFELPEAVAPPDAKADWTVSVVGAPEDKTIGTIREISPLINGSTRSQTIKLALTDPPQSFRLGATVEVSYQRPIAAQFPLPSTAVLDRDGKPVVWVVDPKAMTVSTRPVTLGPTTGTSVAVTDGLSDGDRVVVAGVHSLTDGQVVKLDDEGG